jgi:hypothetical protein
MSEALTAILLACNGIWITGYQANLDCRKNLIRCVEEKTNGGTNLAKGPSWDRAVWTCIKEYKP